MLEKLCSFCCSVPEVCSLSFETAACESLNYCVLFLDWHGLKDKSVHLRMLFSDCESQRRRYRMREQLILQQHQLPDMSDIDV